MKKLLFLCSKNKHRSPTAESIFSEIDGWAVYSAGISNDAEVHVSLEDIEWADYIFVMEKEHKKKLANKFVKALHEQIVISLDIPDNYEFMDKELIKILKAKVSKFVY